MKIMITGHRIEKLRAYDTHWIKEAIGHCLREGMQRGASLGMSGMASGVDLYFCEICLEVSLPYIACIPFVEQKEYMGADDKAMRELYIRKAVEVKPVRNRYMVETCDFGIVVFDGQKGGTANCFQQLVESKKDFWWINPVKGAIVLV